RFHFSAGLDAAEFEISSRRVAAIQRRGKRAGALARIRRLGVKRGCGQHGGAENNEQIFWFHVWDGATFAKTSRASIGGPPAHRISSECGKNGGECGASGPRQPQARERRTPVANVIRVQEANSALRDQTWTSCRARPTSPVAPLNPA